MRGAGGYINQAGVVGAEHAVESGSQPAQPGAAQPPDCQLGCGPRSQGRGRCRVGAPEPWARSCSGGPVCVQGVIIDIPGATQRKTELYLEVAGGWGAGAGRGRQG